MKGSTVRFVNLSLSLVLLASTILVYNALIKPAYTDVNILRGGLASRSDLLRDQRKIVEQVKNLLAQYQGLSGPQKAISIALPQIEEFPTLVNQLRSRAEASGLLLESINFQPLTFQSSESKDKSKQEIPKMATVQISLQLRGSYAAVKALIQSLEANVRIMDMVSLNVATSPTGGSNYGYKLVVNTYYQTI